jgi:hypothetical protein
LFLLHAAIAVFFLAQAQYAMAEMTRDSEEDRVSSSSIEAPRRNSWSPFIVAFAAGGAANVLGKGISASQPASNWEYARRDLLGKLHASM